VKTTGLGFGDGPTAIAFAISVFLFVSYLAIARPDIQPQAGFSDEIATPLGAMPGFAGVSGEIDRE
jgi:hypothetical protein